MCFRNKAHTFTETVCPFCRENLHFAATTPPIEDLEPDLRAIFAQLTNENKDLTKCWSSPYTYITIRKRKYRIENVYYNFFKGDQGNFALRRKCGTIGCVNPDHHRSRFERDDIKTTIRHGFNRKTPALEDLSDAEWLRQH